jgi:hypothetical protein
LVVNVPELGFHRVWKKRGAQYPIDRKILQQIYFDPSVEALFKSGSLITNDVELLESVGLINSEGETEYIELTTTLKDRMIKTMPLYEVKQQVKLLSKSQIDELIEYGIVHYKELALDRVDYFSQISGKNVMGAINNYRAAEEG